MPVSDDDLLSTGEATPILGVTRQHIANLCSRGILPCSMAGYSGACGPVTRSGSPGAQRLTEAG